MAKTGPERRDAFTWVALVVAANLPDVDVASYVGGSDAALWWRRGWSHGPLGLLLLPLVWLGLLGAWDRWRPRSGVEARPSLRSLLPWVYLAALSHPLLDWLNNYGVRFAMPFDSRWFYGDTLFIVDPWLWLLLGIGLYIGRAEPRPRAWGLLAVATTLPVAAVTGSGVWLAGGLWAGGLVLAVVLDRRSPQAARRAVRGTCFGLALVYVLAMTLASGMARSRVVRSVSPQDPLQASQLMVGPVPLTPLRREIILATPEGYRLGEFSWFGDPQISWSENVPKTAPPDVPLGLALSDPCLAGFANWTRFPAARGTREGGGWRVDVFDLRFGHRSVTGFGGAGLRVPAGGAGLDPDGGVDRSADGSLGGLAESVP